MCIFMNPKEAVLMTWWGIERNIDDNVIAHPGLVVSGRTSI